MKSQYWGLLSAFLWLNSCEQKNAVIEIPNYFPRANRIHFDSVSAEQIALGSKLFFDKRLSRDTSIACSSCHRPELAFTDGVERSHGIHGNFSRHNSSTILNVGFSPTFMFDLRASNIEIQPMIPIHDTLEMDMTISDVVHRFERDQILQTQSMTAYHRKLDGYVLTQSLAAFMKSLISCDSKYDKSLKLNNPTLLTDNEQNGRRIFFGKGGCNTCHTAPLFSNYNHYNLAIESASSTDIGKMGATHELRDKFRFKTPMLRNIAITHPYFHNGKIKTLEEAIAFHIAEDRKTRDYTPPKLNIDEQRDLALFLRTLTDQIYLKK